MVRKVALGFVVGVLALVLSGSQIAARAADHSEPVREVVGGHLAPAGRFPWMVRLSMGCGGVLTAPGVVLTAGHCVTGSGQDDTIGVIAGTTDLKSGAAIMDVRDDLRRRLNDAKTRQQPGHDKHPAGPAKGQGQGQGQ